MNDYEIIRTEKNYKHGFTNPALEEPRCHGCMFYSPNSVGAKLLKHYTGHCDIAWHYGSRITPELNCSGPGFGKAYIFKLTHKITGEIIDPKELVEHESTKRL